MELGRELHREYVSNNPFPHIVIEDFLPNSLLKDVVKEFPQRDAGKFSDSHSKLKTGYQLEKIESPLINSLINSLNSSQFLGFLEEMTGIKGLLPDPHQVGGGLHETARGGHLSIHADFNIHPRLKLHRRMNLILFLNDNWQKEYGGALELWRTDMSACEKSVYPLIGRAVIFNTTDDAYHGHPDPLSCPEGVYRRSLALYYYTVPDGENTIRPHSTLFQVRPNSKDERQKRGWKQFLKEAVSPILKRR